MVLCPACSRRMSRVHRSPVQKILYGDSFICPKCKTKRGRLRPALAELVSSLRFVFSKSSRCPKCESYGVYRLTERDRIDSMSSNPVALFQFLLRAPVHKCPKCRLRFYDWRKPRRRVRRSNEPRLDETDAAEPPASPVGAPPSDTPLVS